MYACTDNFKERLILLDAVGGGKWEAASTKRERLARVYDDDQATIDDECMNRWPAPPVPSAPPPCLRDATVLPYPRPKLRDRRRTGCGESGSIAVCKMG